MEPQFVDVELAMLYVPDVHDEVDLSVKSPRELGAGHFEVGIVTEGAFVPLFEYKGGHISDRVAAWKRNHPDSQLPGRSPELAELEQRVAGLEKGATKPAPASSKSSGGSSGGGGKSSSSTSGSGTSSS